MLINPLRIRNDNQLFSRSFRSLKIDYLRFLFFYFKFIRISLFILNYKRGGKVIHDEFKSVLFGICLSHYYRYVVGSTKRLFHCDIRACAKQKERERKSIAFNSLFEGYGSRLWNESFMKSKFLLVEKSP